MSTRTPPGGAQSATPPDHSSALMARNAQIGHVYYWNGDAVQVTHKGEDGSVRVQLVTGWGEDGRPSSLGARVIRLLGDRTLMRTTTLPALEDGAPRVAVPPPSALVEFPSGLQGTPKPNPGGHLDRAQIEAALPTMSDADVRALVQTDKRAFVASLANNELARREADAAKAPRPASPRGLPVASAPPPPSYPSPAPQPKTPRSAPKAAPTPPAAPSAAPSPTDDRVARVRAALAVLNKHAEALLECAAAHKELEALGLSAPRFM